MYVFVIFQHDWTHQELIINWKKLRVLSHFLFSAFESAKECSTTEQRKNDGVTRKNDGPRRGNLTNKMTQMSDDNNWQLLQQTVTDLQDQVRLLHNHFLYNHQRMQYMSLQMYSILNSQHPNFQGSQQKSAIQPIMNHLSKFSNGLLVQNEKGLTGPLQEWIINASKNGKYHSG